MHALTRAARPSRTPLRVAAFADPPAKPAPSTRLTVKVTRRVPYGHAVAVVGDAPALGAWDPARAAKLEWSDGDVWTGAVAVDGAGAGVEFKLVEVAGDGAVVAWAPGANVALAPAPAGGAIVSWDDWDGPATVVEEEVAKVEAAPAPVVEQEAAPTPTPSSPPAVATPVVAASSAAAKAVASMTVPELKAELKAAGLSTAGKKADLVARLKASRE